MSTKSKLQLTRKQLEAFLGNKDPDVIRAFERLFSICDTVEDQYGGIYESGSNANGNWIKFIDGTMVQWGVKARINYVNGYYANAALTLPTAFIDSSGAVVVASMYDTAFFNSSEALLGYWWLAVVAKQASATSIFLEAGVGQSGGGFSPSLPAGSHAYVNWLAIGKWSTASGFAAAGSPPTTSIYASGSTTYGSYIQFTDGTMMAYGSIAGLVANVSTSFTLGVTFVGAYSISGSIFPSNNVTWIDVWGSNATTGSYYTTIGNPNSMTWQAIGKWK